MHGAEDVGMTDATLEAMRLDKAHLKAPAGLAKAGEHVVARYSTQARDARGVPLHGQPLAGPDVVGGAVEEVRYSQMEAAKTVLRHGHLGPWH